ncbi:TonB-dependent receptor domain-containing protein [Chondrinema litorale]|uniref:TonB-dependent receptor domain-containing protein n=1 Tax=Chondrinema litorale TaxID=2994555 RepID=UPI0025435F71|nr:TonB-dependent receptor [Chondrinema litorale]UZR99375.1 TonB-dependent receptor [Chondrinema litorale]
MKLSIQYYLLLAFLPFAAYAQDTHEITGTIIDKETEDPVPFAQVAFFEPGNETPVVGTVTKDNGQFQLEVEEGEYRMEVVFVGYDEKEIKTVKVNKNKSVGNIALIPSSLKLDEIVVEGNEVKRPVTTTLEGVNVRPDQTLSNTGGSVLDVLRNTPSVSVGQDGSITLRGSGNTNILLDGRNSSITGDLEQIPASMIENIQIVNNPNAKYDAQGAGGVINIKLKRGSQKGTTGKAELTVGTRMRTNASVNLSRKSENFNIYGGYSYRSWPGVGNSNTSRDIFSSNERLIQQVDRERNDKEHTFNYGADYFFGKNKISYEGAFNMEDEEDYDNTQTEIRSIDTDDLILQYKRINNEIEDNYSFDNAFIYERTFDNPDRELRAVVSHSYRDQQEQQIIDIYNNITDENDDVSRYERSTSDDFNSNIVMQVDYVHPFDNAKLETGYKSIFRTMENDYLYEAQDPDVGEWVNRADVSNRFRYEDKIFAAYAIFSSSIGDKLDYALGTRAEQTMVDTKLYNNNETNEQNYLNFFPSVQAQYFLDKSNSLKFTYSRRIDRPSSRRLNPFPDISDSLNIRIGNPNLQPEFINSFEFGHMLSKDKFEITTNAFFRHVNGQIDWIVRVEDGISYRGPLNLNNAMTYGLELINTTQLTNWWNMNFSYSIFQTQVDGTNLNADYTNKGLSWYAKLNTDFSLPLDVDMQITANYRAPEVEAQGKDLARYYMDLSFQKSFMDDKANATLSIRDLFNTRSFRGENFGEDFFQEFEYKRESRIALLSLSYSL